MSLKSLAKSALLAAVSAVTGRHAVLLPPEAGSDDVLMSLKAPYRVEGNRLGIDLLEPASGELEITLLGYRGHFPTRRLWRAAANYPGASPLVFDLERGRVTLDGTNVGDIPLPIPGRRFCVRLELETAGTTLRRITGHYLASVGDSYYEGGNYVDYESEAQGSVPQVLELVRKHDAKGPLLEIGCATGVVLEGLDATGLECFGLDDSAWAVERAAARVGADRVFQCNVESSSLPEPVADAGSFRTLLLWSVLEHFREPFRVLERLDAHLARGGKVLISTTNAESLTHALFGPQWEGYFDSSHYSVDAVSVSSLRRELPRLGWRIEGLTTHLSWDSNPDPTHETLRQWWALDARFRRLLSEHDRGDLITCVAVKE